MNNLAEAEACDFIAQFIYERCRIRLHDGKHALIKARLGKHVRKHGFADLAEYCHFLKTTAGEDEFTEVTDALTTNFTHFLREKDHFDFLVGTALPLLLSHGAKECRIWCAASSSGEEPYSIAMYLCEYSSTDRQIQWSLEASDISTRVLDQARLGVYPLDRMTAVPEEWMRKYFQKGVGKWEGQCRVKPTLSERIAFRQINLTEPYNHPCLFQAVFCRNVLIYFDRPTQQRLLEHLCQFIAPNGYLFVGHSESLNGLKLPVRCVHPSVYQRTTA